MDRRVVGKRFFTTFLRGGWDDPNCARPTRAFLSRALREHGDRPSYPVSFFSSLLEGWFEETKLPFLGTGQGNGIALGKASVAILGRVTWGGV